MKLEGENFRVDSVDSKGWRQITDEQGITYLESLGKDIREYVAGVPKKLIGQQLFITGQQLLTRLAVISETQKKRVSSEKQATPTDTKNPYNDFSVRCLKD